jgi:hypothetical protein
MTTQEHRLIDLAADQLETAIGLFIGGGHDRFSVITLAGAADGIFTRLVNHVGGESFIEALVRDADEPTTRGAMGKHVNDLLFINYLKHMDDGEDGAILIDVEECAVAAILKAIANFVKLGGDKADFVQAFLEWIKHNLDPSRYNVNCDPNWKPPTPSPTET